MTKQEILKAWLLSEGNEIESIDEIEETSYNENEFNFDGMEFLVLTDEEADEEAKQCIINFIDELGIGGFTPNFQETILNEFCDLEWFDEAMKESFEFYCDDIKSEDVDEDEDGNETNRLTEEMEENNCETEEDYVEHLCNENESGAEWYKFNFGEDAFSEAVKNHCNLEEDEIADECINLDGRGMQLAGYDHNENEFYSEDREMFYIYRTN